MPDWYMKFGMPLLIACMAAFVMVIGLRGLMTRKPFLISARWLYAFALLGFLPQAIAPFLVSFPGDMDTPSSLHLVQWFGPVMFVLLAGFFALVMRGYIAFGITDDSMRQGLFASLDHLQLPYEESLGLVRLPTASTELQVAIQGWVGTAQLKPRKRAGAELVGKIAAGMNQYFRSSAVSINLTTCVVYIILGVALVGLDVTLFLIR